MTQTLTLDPKMQAAVDELAGMISQHHPTAQFRVTRHPEESGLILLDAVVDVDDTEEVLDLVFERMEQLRIDEGVPLLVIPLHTPARVAKLLEEMQATRQASIAAARS